MIFNHGTLAVVLAATVNAFAPMPTYQPDRTVLIITNDYNAGTDCKYPGGSHHLDMKQIYEFGQMYGINQDDANAKYGRYIARAPHDSWQSLWTHYVQTEFVFGDPDPNTPGALPTYTLWEVSTMVNGVKVSRRLLFDSFN